MPVNMDPKRRRRPGEEPERRAEDAASAQEAEQVKSESFGSETDEDREKAMADAECQNLWDATEVIDMDKW